MSSIKICLYPLKYLTTRTTPLQQQWPHYHRLRFVWCTRPSRNVSPMRSHCTFPIWESRQASFHFLSLSIGKNTMSSKNWRESLEYAITMTKRGFRDTGCPVIREVAGASALGNHQIKTSQFTHKFSHEDVAMRCAVCSTSVSSQSLITSGAQDMQLVSYVVVCGAHQSDIK